MTMIVKSSGILLLLLLLSFFNIPSSRAIQEENKTVRSNEPFHKARNVRIIGGYKCLIEKYPFLVLLRQVNAAKHFCAGTLLSKFWILTAMHCLKTRCDQPIEVVAGSNYPRDLPKKGSNTRKLQFSTIQRCFLYPVNDEQQFDISLARLKKGILEANNVGYVTLSFQLFGDGRDEKDICSNATVLGWGVDYTRHENRKSLLLPKKNDDDSHLQCVHLSVISQEECINRSYTNTLKPSFFCAYRSMHSGCLADSGGPFMCSGCQFGIVSHGFDCVYNDYPNVYTNVSYFKEFILSTMESAVVNPEKSTATHIRAVKLSSVLVIVVLYLLH